MILTEADTKLLVLAMRKSGGYHIAVKWYTGMELLPYQIDFHQTDNKNVTFIAGLATGKSTGVAASYLMDCLTLPYFRAMNTSVTEKQAEIPFEMVQAWIDVHKKRLNHLIEDIALRPYPVIKFMNGAEWVFRTSGKDGRYIRGLEFDRINYDEAGLDFTGETIRVLRSRLRGNRVDGSPRMARLDVITSPTDSPWLIERFNRGWHENNQYDPLNFHSMRVSTYQNTKLPPEQIRLMESEYTDDMIDVELKGLFPEYGSTMFAKGHVNACLDQALNDILVEALENKGMIKKGYLLEEHPRYGITKFEYPALPGNVYVLGGDPGTDDPPKRNSGVVFVADVTKKPYRIVYFDWVYGRGSYTPFLQSYKYALDKYLPVFRGMDTTGTQKAIDELAFQNYGIEIDAISFNGNKDAMLNSLSMIISNHQIVCPIVKGIRQQLSTYSRENDNKLAQDIVMCLAEIAYLARQYSGETSEVQHSHASTYSKRHFRRRK